MAELLNIELDGRPVVSDTISEPEIPVVRGQKVYIETYGCQMNVSDTELMMGILKRAGYQSSSRPEDADVVLLNTCAIREHAEELGVPVVELYEPFQNRARELMSNDFIHPNDAGYRVMADAVIAALAALR